MADEIPRLVLSSSDRIMSRGIGEEGSPSTDRWEVSSPIPGMRIVNSWQIYNKIWLVLAIAEDGQYNIFRSIDLLRYTLVHQHGSRIYGLYYIDDGRAVFCAEDGWWATDNTGIYWQEIFLCTDPPLAKSVAVIQMQNHVWNVVAYAQDHKIYYIEYPGGEWEDVYDTTKIWTDKWYPAIAGGPIGLLAGAGNQLLRSDDAGATWYLLQEVEGIIKNIVISNQSLLPTFLITVEPLAGDTDRLYLTYDLGDSLVPVSNRVGPLASVQSVIPTGTNEQETSFVILGQRTPGASQGYKILGE